MRLLLLSEATYPRHPGGAGKAAHVLAAGLAARGHTVHLVSGNGDLTERERIEGVDVHRVASNPPPGTAPEEREAATARRILGYLEQALPLDRVDLVHDIGGFLSFFAPLELHLRRQRRIPLVVHFQFLNLPYLRACGSGAFDPFQPGALQSEADIHETPQCFAVRIADMVVCPSFSEAGMVRRLFRPPADRLTVVPNPVRAAPPRVQEVRAWRARLAPAGETLVLFGGRVETEMKGGDVVRRAFDKVFASRRDVRLVLLASEEAAAPFRAFGDRVAVTGWQRDGDAVASLLVAADVVLVPSRYEPFGLMCGEAMLAGTAVVASPVGGLRDMVRHGRTGFLFRSHDPGRWADELAGYVALLLDRPALARRMGEEGRRVASESYGGAVFEQMEAVYDAVLRRGVRGRGGPSPPRTGVEDLALYRDEMERSIGITPALPAWAERALVPSGWNTSVDRCLACSRAKLARDALALSTDRGPVNACPLGLLQRAFLRRAG